jgi:uncharacterized LabA/DUF88 family protein
MKKSNIYIDGFNLFYGLLKGSSYKWLNIESCFEKIYKHDEITSIKYFTALVKGEGLARQQVYLQALRTLSKVEIILGNFKGKLMTCGVSDCDHPNKTFRVFEEKRTDVNIAIEMLHDASKQSIERFILVSGDSDLVPVLHMLRRDYPAVNLIVLIPAKRSKTMKDRYIASEIREAAHHARLLDLSYIRTSQFADLVLSSTGIELYKPIEW